MYRCRRQIYWFSYGSSSTISSSFLCDGHTRVIFALDYARPMASTALFVDATMAKVDDY
jgi:hypothetical protein